ncbi:MAG TPA: 4-(cytidine 5'-diphospho)-2-C-methyl-D-erythritol kinase, partial [Clostridiales bacterium]|nr:4-(cytidine 5'-diphospho)-2-C-methyl-D-erythritol kinase [Clostridiales bacterium]
MLALAYAKINLMLDILDRTEDGYHTCFNVMQSVSLADRVTLLPTGKPGTIELHCTDPSAPIGEDNLAYRAAARFFSESGCQ